MSAMREAALLSGILFTTCDSRAPTREIIRTSKPMTRSFSQLRSEEAEAASETIIEGLSHHGNPTLRKLCLFRWVDLTGIDDDLV